MQAGRVVGAAARRARVLAAQRDPSVFVDGLYTHPTTGAAIEAAPFQRRWHRLAETHPRLVLWAPVEHGKTQRFMGHLIWRLGKNPQGHGLIVGESAGAAEKLLSSIRRTIDENPWVQEVFPHVRPMKGRYAKWTDEAIRIAGQSADDKDFSLQAIGWGGAILGARLHWVLGDDLCTYHTTATALQREKVRAWWLSTIEGRLLRDARVTILGNAWFPDDVMHLLVKDSGYAGHKDEAYRERADGSIDERSILWPGQWDAERFAAFKARAASPVEANRQMRCIPYGSGSSHFDIAWFDAAFERGGQQWSAAFGKLAPRFLESYGGPWPVYTGVDLGVGQHRKADKTSIFTIAVDPVSQTRYPIKVETGRWTGPDIVQKLKAVYAKFPGRILVENNGAQEFLLQWTREQGLPVESFTTSSAKADPVYGVPALATELASNMWALPMEPEMHTWRAQCLAFEPRSHVGDMLMSSWFAREAARTSSNITSATIDPHDTRSAYSLRARYDLSARRGLRRVS